MKGHIMTLLSSLLLLFYVLVIAPAILSSGSDKALDMAATFAVILFIFVVVSFLLACKAQAEEEGDEHE